ncbi:MAG TPA: CdvA-like protein [Candidatus Acidoferrales bacterium]|nr:CdvA-like protein [Candidatus Acidoferrales bacterium]
MTVTVEEIGKHLGQTIQDMMGRPMGKIVGLSADVKDEVQSIQIARSDGDVTEHTITAIRIIDGHPILLQMWRVEAEGLEKEHSIIKRRRQAIDQLLKDGDIDQTEYNQLRNSYEEIHKEILTKRDGLVDTLKEVESKLDQQVRDLQTALTNNKMLYTAAEIDERTYQTVTESVRTGLDITRKERKDVDSTRIALQEIDSLEPTKPAVEVPSAPTSIPDVVVIKMREST